MHNFLVMIKPDGVKRGLIGEIISRFEKKGFVIEQMEMLITPLHIIQEHYQSHQTKGYYNDIINHSQSGKSLIMNVYGNIEEARRLVGETPFGNSYGTIRGDFSNGSIENIIHCSHNAREGLREIALWF